MSEIEFKRVSDLSDIEWEAYGEDEYLARAGFELKEAMAEYIVQSQMSDRCNPENFDNARKEILATLEEIIERIREGRRAARGQETASERHYRDAAMLAQLDRSGTKA